MPPRGGKKPTKAKDLPQTSLPEEVDNPPLPVKKGRGRPRKELPENDVSAPAPSEKSSVPKKRGRKAAPPTDNEDEFSPQKKQRMSLNTAGRTPSTVAGGVRTKSKAVPKRDPLPRRDARNEHPGAREGVGPAPRRKPSELAAERDAVRRAAEEQIRKGKEAAEFLAQMQFAQEQNDAMMEMESDQRLSAFLRAGQHSDRDTATDSGGEEFDAVDSGGDSESSITVVKEKKKTGGRKAGKGKRGVRGDVDKIVKEMRDASESKTSHIPTSDTVPKKYKNSGLVKNKGKTKNDHQPAVAFGGLDDDNVEQENPFPVHVIGRPAQVKYPPNLQRDVGRKNALVTGIQAGSSVKPTKRKAVAQSKRTIASNAVSQAHGVHNSDSDNGHGIAEIDQSNWFTGPQWSVVFLSSLSQALYVARHPFDDFKKDSPQFIKTVQEVFALSHPEIVYRFRAGDKFIEKAARWMNERKSKLAATVLMLVKAIFNTNEYRGQPDKVREHCLWAIKMGALYATPTPMGSKTKPGDIGYIEPGGIFQSKLIIQVTRQFISYAQKSKLEPEISPDNPPKGLYALVLSAIERAFATYLPSGIFKEPKEFSHNHISEKLRVYMTQLEERFSRRRWSEELLPSLLVDSPGSEEGHHHGDLSLISAQRGDFFIPPSPVKAS